MRTKDWPALAEALGKAIPPKRLHRAVVSWIELEGGATPWALACSGGADSLCMILLLYAHYSDFRGRMHLLHFNHLLRGADSNEDEAFVQSLAEGLGIKYSCGKWESFGEKTSGAGPARQARFHFFDESMQQIESKALFLGHQLEDIAETMLLRVGRGSGSGGLAAPRPVHTFRSGKVHLRPLLELRKEEITGALAAAEIPWREDDSNRSEKYTRNRMRHGVLPAWRRASPQDVFQGAARTRALAEEDEEALENWLDALLPEVLLEKPLDFSSLAGKPQALWRRAFHRFLVVNCLENILSSDEVDRWVTAMRENRTQKGSVGKTAFIEYKDGRLLLIEEECEPDWLEIRAPIGATVYWPDSSSLIINTMTLSTNQRASILAGEVEEQREAILEVGEESSPFLRIRRWATGDRYWALGAPGSRKLQDIFTDRKIPAVERKRLPVVCTDDGKILWAPGLPPADGHKISENTAVALRLTYLPPSAT